MVGSLFSLIHLKRYIGRDAERDDAAPILKV
jgi:hypothetical protein